MITTITLKAIPAHSISAEFRSRNLTSGANGRQVRSRCSIGTSIHELTTNDTRAAIWNKVSMITHSMRYEWGFNIDLSRKEVASELQQRARKPANDGVDAPTR